jgi:transcriptional regulator with XRE-family HTH domain
MTSPGWRPQDTFGARLVLVRREKKMSVEVAAATCGVSQATWSTWERGAQPRKLVEIVTTISDALGVDRDWLMWGGALTQGGSGSSTWSLSTEQPNDEAADRLEDLARAG